MTMKKNESNISYQMLPISAYRHICLNGLNILGKYAVKEFP